MFKWVAGRQNTGYRKLELFTSKLLSCDCYLIDYAPDTFIPIHVDPVPNKKHYRLNVLLIGEDRFRGETIFETKRVKFFRPDIMPHEVLAVGKRRMILSIGWAR